MNTASPLPNDLLAELADGETQRAAARHAQDVFGEVFRRAFTPDPYRAYDEGFRAQDADLCANEIRSGSRYRG